MNIITKTLNKIFKSGNQQELDKIKPLITKINSLEASTSLLKDSDFKEKTVLFKKNIRDGRKLNDLIPETWIKCRHGSRKWAPFKYF